jgi:hypothetical protein
VARPYWWYQGESVKKIRAELNAAGDEARIEVHLDGNDMTVHVIPPVAPAGGGGGGGTNDSHVCPPSCP